MTAVAADPLPVPARPTPGPPAPFVSAASVRKAFAGRAVLADVDLDIGPGELVALLGPSGCGKTTLLRVVAGLDRPDAGRVTIAGRDVTDAPPGPRRCGIVFQSYALFPNLTVAANVAFGMAGRRTRGDRRRRVAELLDLIGLPDVADRHPAQLSGGQQQRVALARALAIDPAVLLLDEPLSALDAKVRGRLRAEVRRIQRRLTLSTLLVTHDQEEALTMADRVAVMDAGRVLQVGTPLEVYARPNGRAVAEFVGTMNVLPGWRPDGGRLVRGDRAMRCPVACDEATVAVAFRPEAARLGRPGSAAGDGFDAVVRTVEFRGPTCRVYLTDDDAPIVVDVLAADSAGRSAGDAVAVLLDLEQVRLFRPDGTAVA